MREIIHDAQRLKELQALPLERKILISQARIIEWYKRWNGNVCVSYSGGKDSTVLLHLVRSLYPHVPAVFCNTGLEYPEIQRFAREQGATFVTPEMPFTDVILKYGYPLIGKEVAEAIHYARKIKGGGKTTLRKRIELHREREKADRNTWNATEDERTCKGGGEKEIAQQKNSLIQTSSARNRRTILTGRLTPIGATGEEAVFSNAKQQFGDRSQFNKEKWLPLAQELPAKISHYCCNVMKKRPIKKYQKENGLKPYLGTLATESRIRRQAWLRHGCNAFDSTNPTSQPLSFWTEQDILAYLARYEFIDICPLYGDIVEENGKLTCTGLDRTGCIFCGFGFHRDKGETRFQKLARTHTKQYEYCIGGGQWSDNPDYDPTAPEYDGIWKNWNPEKIWTPSKEGLGMGKLFDMVNEIYGKDFYRYK